MSTASQQPARPLTDQEWGHLAEQIRRRVVAARRRSGVKHRDVAAATGKTIWTAMRYCSGVLVPDLRDLVCLARLYKCTVSDLTGIP